MRCIVIAVSVYAFSGSALANASCAQSRGKKVVSTALTSFM
jgi:hypothetical protein